MKKILNLAILAFLPFLLNAQGTISGTILDEKYGDPLIGANVVIEGTTTGASTDFDGKYSFDLEAGTYNIVMSYIGYQDKTIQEVIVKEGEITYLDGALSDEAQELDLNVVVKAKAIERSENALLMLQRKSDKIQNGISSQEMSRLAVGNAAKAMGKVTGTSVVDGKYVYVRGLGDRYSIAQLNGLMLPSIDPYRNSVQLDLIPTSLLDNIITAKNFTPDQPATFTGGNLNIKTKSLPEREIFKVSISTEFNPQNNLIDNFLTYDDGVDTDWLGYGAAQRARPDFLDDPEVSQFLDQN
ncbi:MAG: carboxypeptidase-like regulatory domain-containing protein, partial [Bacteroidota bacterium]